MLNNNLIKKCTCGNDENFSPLVTNGVDVLTCNSCGVIHQLLENWTTEDYINFYKTDYHQVYQKNRGTMTYEERYEHDCKVSDLRLDTYNLPENSNGLDIGSSNSSFVHRAIARNLCCVGLEPGADIGDDTVTVRGTLDDDPFEPEQFDFVTMHDSIEHMVDVTTAVQQVWTILKKGSIAFIDLPDYFNPKGQHHWKRIEHLWFFTEAQFQDILTKNGFVVDKVTYPIPGKLVFYAKKI